MQTAFVTASYVSDYDRCTLLCESMDRFVAGEWHHYLVVENRDVALFETLQGPRRSVVSEAELFPFWLKAFPDPTNFGRRRVWLSPFSLPLRGWHAQQIRRLAMARYVQADTFVFVDSDVVIIRPFDPASFWKGKSLRLLRVDNGAMTGEDDHLLWLAHAGTLLGLPRHPDPAHDYISTLIAWRGDTMCALLDHIEAHTGKNWVRALIASRAMSECMIYGRFVDEILMGEGHFHASQSLCHILWQHGAAPKTSDGLDQFIKEMGPDQVAIGIQSFIGHDIAQIRRVAFSPNTP